MTEYFISFPPKHWKLLDSAWMHIPVNYSMFMKNLNGTGYSFDVAFEFFLIEFLFAVCLPCEFLFTLFLEIEHAWCFHFYKNKLTLNAPPFTDVDKACMLN